MNKLIFDLGCHTLDSTERFLDKGYTIIAIDADIDKLKLIDLKYNKYIQENKLILVNKAIYSEDNCIVNFYIQPNNTVWNSLFKNISERSNVSKCIKVDTITLRSLIQMFGIPEYCKIDIEGADIIALNSLSEDILPKFISCETECLGLGDILDPLKVVRKLHQLGYSKFYLEKQPSNLTYTDIVNWINYEELEKLLLKTRENHKFRVFYDFWYDVYATI